MRNLRFIFAALFFCSQICFGQTRIALVSDDAEGKIINSSIEIEMVGLKAISTDDCDHDMQFSGTAKIYLGDALGNLIYRFDAEPSNSLKFGKDAYFTTMGYDYGQQVDVLFKIHDKDKRSCGSLIDIVDTNSQKTENSLKIRIEGNEVWLLNSQNLKMKVLGYVGQMITIRGNSYVNNNVNHKRVLTKAADKRKVVNQHRGGKWNLPPTAEDWSAPDIEVGEFQFVVRKETGR